MSGTRAGGLKCAATNKQIHGEDFYKRIGSMGGKVRNPKKGFGSSHDRAVSAGHKGRTQRDLNKVKGKYFNMDDILKLTDQTFEFIITDRKKDEI